MAGLQVDVRPLMRPELDFHLEHLMRLDGHARAQRFAAGVDDHFVLSHCLRLVAGEPAVVGAFIGDFMRGSAELDCDEDNQVCEISLAIERPWRRQGLGHRLMAGALDLARARGVASVRLDAPASDEAIARIARKAGFRHDKGRIGRTYQLTLADRTALRPADAGERLSWNPFRRVPKPA